jgi:CubicO group peptidase (beta-lactamase class C family)/surface polysaccharide O-acyltransferase-like enzyme
MMIGPGTSPTADVDVRTMDPARVSVRERDGGLDLLRGLAVGRVFLWHATGYAALTWVAAIPVMVFLSGSVLGNSVLDRGPLTVITERFRRLLVPLWVYALAAWSVMIGVELAAGRSVPWHRLGFWILPVSDPVGTDWSNGWLSEPLWYLRLLLWLIAALPLLAWMAKRAALRSIAACGVGTIVAESALDGRHWELQDFVLFSGFFIAGLATAHGTLPTLGRPWGWLLALGAALAAGWVIVNGIDSWTVNDSHVLHLAVGIATLGAAGLGIDLLRRAASSLPHLTDAVSRRSLSIYLWHSAAIAAVLGLSAPWRSWFGDGPHVRLGVALVAALVTAAIVSLVGGVEDTAARRSVRREPTRWVLPGIVTVAMLVATAPFAPAAADDAFVLPPPSQAPLPGDYDAGGDAVEGAAEPAPSGSGEVSVRMLEAVPELAELAPPADETKSAQLDQLLSTFATDHAPGGVGALVLRPGVGLWIGGAGADPIDVEHMNPLGSITKSFTAALVLRAVDAGLIDLDQTVGTLEVAPWFDEVERITYRQLLAHTAGIPHYRELPEWGADRSAIDGWEPVLSAAHRAGLQFEPGTASAYSSSNYIVAGLAIEQLYGAPIEELLQRELLDPLGLDRIVVNGPGPAEPHSGTAGLDASIGDVARWATAMWRNRVVLSAPTHAEHLDISPASMFGPGSIGFCPCWTQTDGETHESGVGYYGGLITVKFYERWDAVVVIVSHESIWEGAVPGAIDALSAALAETAAN